VAWPGCPGERRPERRRNLPAIAIMPCQTDCGDYSAAPPCRSDSVASSGKWPTFHARRRAPGGACGVRARRYGGVAEWLKAHAWKACLRETVTWVRIPPPPPPQNRTANAGSRRFCARDGAGPACSRPSGHGPGCQVRDLAPGAILVPGLTNLDRAPSKPQRSGGQSWEPGLACMIVSAWIVPEASAEPWTTTGPPTTSATALCACMALVASTFTAVPPRLAKMKRGPFTTATVP
jgi:hypothetical protein